MKYLIATKMETSELKKKLIDGGLSEAHADTLIGFGEKAGCLKKERRVFGSFRAEVDEGLCVVISAVNGWKVSYPPMCNAWVYLITWMDQWDECSDIMEGFVKLLLFPVANTIESIDEKYISDIVAACSRVADRSGEDDIEYDNQLGEKIIDAMSDIAGAMQHDKP